MCSRLCLQRWNKIVLYNPTLKGIDLHPQTLKPRHHFRFQSDELRTTDIVEDEDKSLCKSNDLTVVHSVRDSVCNHLPTLFKSRMAKENAFGFHCGRSNWETFHTQIVMDETQRRFVGCVVSDDVLKVLGDAKYQDMYQFEQHFQVKTSDQEEGDKDEAAEDLMALLWEMVEKKEQNQMWEFQSPR